jgi:DNA-binding NtrC family response regulator
MEAMPPRSRLGTYPPDSDSHHDNADEVRDDIDAPQLGLTVRLDRPFHELKEFLLAEFERAYVTRCLTESEMNVSMASRQSGLSRKHLRTLMAKYGIRRTEIANDIGADIRDIADIAAELRDNES